MFPTRQLPPPFPIYTYPIANATIKPIPFTFPLEKSDSPLLRSIYQEKPKSHHGRTDQESSRWNQTLSLYLFLKGHRSPTVPKTSSGATDPTAIASSLPYRKRQHQEREKDYEEDLEKPISFFRKRSKRRLKKATGDHGISKMRHRKGWWCKMCGISSTPERRRGPDNLFSLCNACGLYYAKMIKKEQQNPPKAEPSAPIAINQLLN
jgi:hypothetical protein